MNKQEVIKQFFNILQEDESYRRSWKDNIAMSFKDEFWRTCTTHKHLDLMDDETLHNIANASADNFLNLLIK